MGFGEGVEVERGMRAFSKYIYNTGGRKFAEDLFPDEYQPYKDGYAEAWGRSPAAGIGKLDDANLRKLFAIMLERYG
jgi:hypothetical protein